MNNTVSLQRISQTGNLDSNLKLRQYKLDPMARFIQIKSMNPRLKQSEIAEELGCSNSTLQRYRNDIKKLPHYRIRPNSHKRRQKTPNREHDLDRPQKTQMKTINRFLRK